MATNEELKELAEQIGKRKPEMKAALDQLMEEKKKLVSLFAVEEIKDVTIDGKPARITIYKRAFISVQFRDMNECKAAIEKLVK